MTARFHGPASPLGAVVALFVLASPLVIGATSAIVWSVAVGAPIVVGALLLVVAGRLRNFGTGLLVGTLTYPLVIAMIVLVSVVVDIST